MFKRIEQRQQRFRLLSLVAFSIAAVSAILFSPGGPALSQEWPSKPIRIIIGFGPGGGTDIASRTISQPLSEVLGQPVVVENKPGGGGLTGAEYVAKSAKDGYTAYMMNNAHGLAPAIYKALPFDPVNDFEMVSQVGIAGLVVLASPQFPASDIKGLIAAAKANPGKYNFASNGLGGTQHFSGELLRQLGGIDIRHIPYRTTPAAIAATRANEVDLLFELIQPTLGQIRSGDLKVLAVTSPGRFPSLPDVPSVAESGVQGYDVTSWYGLAFPAGTPRPIIEKMNSAIKQVLARDDVRKRILDSGALVKSSSPEELKAHVANEVVKWRKVGEKAGIVQQ